MVIFGHFGGQNEPLSSYAFETRLRQKGFLFYLFFFPSCFFNVDGRILVDWSSLLYSLCSSWFHGLLTGDK